MDSHLHKLLPPVPGNPNWIYVPHDQETDLEGKMTANRDQLLRLSELSAPRRVLLRLCQSINYGQILDLRVVNGEPTFNPPPTILLDVRLNGNSDARPESLLEDFVLGQEAVRLLNRIEQFQSGKVRRIEVQAGLPKRLQLEANILEA